MSTSPEAFEHFSTRSELEAENTALREALEAARKALKEQAVTSTAPARSDTLQHALYRISETTHSSRDLSDIYAQIHRIISDLLPAQNCLIALYDEETTLVSFPYYVDEFDPPPPPRPLSENGLTHRVIRTGQAVLMKPDERAQRIARGEPIIGTICLDWLGVPLKTEGRVIGALAVQSYHGDVRYTDADKELLAFVSSQVAAAIERRRTTDRLIHLAWHDPLTGLPNRALLHERLSQTILLAKRQKRRFAYASLDLDRFKPINDQYGHATGDEVLVQVAARITARLRESDTVARMGGDEFSLLLQDITNQQQTIELAQSVCQQLEKPFFVNGIPHHVTASIGIAIFPDNAQDAGQLAALSDAALYRAKEGGRNQVRVSEDRITD
jgi:diguanylate cyclase (GGDEF)-like protein